MCPNEIPNTVGGYTCSVCGQWASLGQYHLCPNVPTFTPNFSTNIYINNEILERIAKALEAIQKVLDEQKQTTK